MKIEHSIQKDSTPIDAEPDHGLNPHVSSIVEAMGGVCLWRLENLNDAGVGGFTTKCGLVYFFGAHPKDNGYKFCPNCGKSIKYLSPAVELKTGENLQIKNSA